MTKKQMEKKRVKTMERKLVDNLCTDWHFDIDNLEHLVFDVSGKLYTRKIYDCSETATAYIIFKGEKYYFEYPQEESKETTFENMEVL